MIGANLLVLFFVLAIFSSCDKSSDIGLSIQPENELLGLEFTDTSTVIALTIREDSLLTSKVSSGLLGNFNDPEFGITNASIYTQIRLSKSNPDFGANPTVDSIVLTLVYDDDYYGKLDPQTIEAYELNEQLYSDSAYYSNQDISNKGVDLANSFNFTPNPTDSVLVDSTLLKPLVRIPLSNTLGQSLLSNASQMSSNDVFTTFFNGLYIKAIGNPSTDQGGILYFDLTDALSGLKIYYHNDTATKQTFFFPIDADAQRFNRFEHDYSSTAISNQLADSTLGQQVCYIQKNAGLRTKFYLPGVTGLLDSGKISINKAELSLKVDVNKKQYDVPDNLTLVAIDSLGNSLTILDASLDTSHYGGAYDDTDKEYVFNVSRQLQGVLDGREKNFGFYILAPGGAVASDRLVIGGPQNAQYPLKLSITYTKLY